MTGSWGHHAKWNRSDREDKYPVFIGLIKNNLELTNTLEWWLSETGEKGWCWWKRGNVGPGVQTSGYKMNKF